MDLDVLRAAVIVNPFSRAGPLAGHPRFVVAGIIEPLKCLYILFFREGPFILDAELCNCLAAEG